MESHFASIFQQERYSDADLSIQLSQECMSGGGASAAQRKELNRFPVHLVILSQSPYFQSQDNFMEQQQQQQTRERSRSPVRGGNRLVDAAAATMSRRTRQSSKQTTNLPTPQQSPVQRQPDTSSGSGSSRRPTLVLTLRAETHEPAAVAVIAAMYGVKSALSNLQQPELVYAVQYADLLQAESVTAEALQLLQTEADAEAGLTIEALTALVALPSWPDCMQALLPSIAKTVVDDAAAMAATDTTAADADADSSPVASKNTAVQQILLATLGDLERVWQQLHLSQLLLQLPLPALYLLLRSDQLSVHSEDTVLYTVTKYVAAQEPGQQSAIATTRLSALVRVPQRSDFQLMTRSFWHGPNVDVLEAHRGKLRQVLQLKRLQPDFTDMGVLDELCPPSSWLCGPRQICRVPSTGVQVLWKLPVSELTALCKKSFESKGCCKSYSPHTTPPLAGLEWKVMLQSKYITEANGVRLGVFAHTRLCPDRIFYKFKFGIAVSVGPKCIELGSGDTPPLKGATGCGWPDFFKFGAMAGGWDESAWVSKGLPLQGELDVTLSVHKVF